MFGRNNESENTNAALGEHSSTENRRGQSSHDRILEGNHDVSAFVGEGVEFQGIAISGSLDRHQNKSPSALRRVCSAFNPAPTI